MVAPRGVPSLPRTDAVRRRKGERSIGKRQPGCPLGITSPLLRGGSWRFPLILPSFHPITHASHRVYLRRGPLCVGLYIYLHGFAYYTRVYLRELIHELCHFDASLQPSHVVLYSSNDDRRPTTSNRHSLKEGTVGRMDS